MLNVFQNLPIRQKLLVANGLFLLCIIGIVGLSIANMLTLKAENDKLNNVLLPSVSQLSELTDKYWMTRIRLLLIPIEQDATKREALKAQVHEFKNLYFTTANNYKKLVKSPEEDTLYKAFMAFNQAEKTDLDTLVPLIDNSQYTDALAWQGEHGGKQYNDFDEASEALVEYNVNQIEANHTQAEKAFHTTFLIFLILSIGIVVAVLAFTFWFARLLNSPIQSVKTALTAVADGDLSQNITPLTSQDELGDLTRSLNSMVGNLTAVVSDIQHSANSVTTASGELTHNAKTLNSTAQELLGQASSSEQATQDLSTNVTVVANAVEESSANIRHIFDVSEKVAKGNQDANAAVQHISQNIHDISRNANDMTTSVHTVASAIEEMSASLSEVAQSAAQAAHVANTAERITETSSVTINRLGQSANEIGNIVDVIKNIASQTNLLALNATIEAASAGDAGKGFAVVANEVKELAEQSATASEDIRRRIAEIQATASEAVSTIRDIANIIQELNSINTVIASAVQEQTSTVSEISHSVSIVATSAQDVNSRVSETVKEANVVAHQVEAASSAVQEIVRNIEELNLGTNEIARNAQSAATGTSAIHDSVKQVSNAASRTSVSSQEILTTANNLSVLAQQLNTIVSKFTLVGVGKR